MMGAPPPVSFERQANITKYNVSHSQSICKMLTLYSCFFIFSDITMTSSQITADKDFNVFVGSDIGVFKGRHNFIKQSDPEKRPTGLLN